MNAYLASARSGAQRLIGTPSELIARACFYGIVIIVLASLWRAAASATGGEVVGYDAVAITWYIVFAEAAVNGTKFRMIEQIGTDIGSGAVAVEMLRPIDVVWFRISNEIGDGILRFLTMAVVGSTLALLIAGAPHDPALLAMGLASGLLAIACNITAQHGFAAMAFWQHEAKGAWFLYQKLVFILGGMLLPLEIFPGWLQAVARLSPFWTMAYAPARLAAGFDEPMLIVGQTVWLVVLFGFATWVFGMGERRLQIGGG